MYTIITQGIWYTFNQYFNKSSVNAKGLGHKYLKQLALMTFKVNNLNKMVLM